MAQPKILVVDDDKEIVGAIKKRLELEGYDVVPAYNGLEALDVLVEQDIQLLIIDIMMPGMDGLSATMKIRESKNIPDCKGKIPASQIFTARQQSGRAGR